MRKNVLVIILILSSGLFFTSCNKTCNRESAVNEFKETAWNALLSPNEIWFPDDNEMNIIENGNFSKQFSCDFTSYGKILGVYYQYNLSRTIKCSSLGQWELVSDNSDFVEEVIDSAIIKDLQNTSSSEYNPK